MSDYLVYERKKIISFENIVLIFIDNEENVRSDAEDTLDKYWPNAFGKKRYILATTEKVETIIQKNGEKSCIVICDKNLEDVRGEDFVIQLRNKFENLFYLVLYTAEVNRDLSPLLKLYEIEYIVKTPDGFKDLMLTLKNKLIPANKRIKLNEVFKQDKGISMSPNINTLKNDDTITTIFRGTISHLDRSNKILEMRVQNPENEKEFAYKNFPVHLFGDLSKISINQIFYITEKISNEGRMSIDFEDTKEIEPSPNLASKWDDEIKGAFENIPKL